MQPQVLVSGYVSLDRMIKIDKDPIEGKTSIVINETNSDVFFGGCSVNISVLLAKLGVEAMALLRVGNDYSSTGFKEFLEKSNVNTSAVQVVENDRTSNCYLIQSVEGNHITLFYPGAQDKKHFRPLDPKPFGEAELGILTVGAEPDNAEFLRCCKQAKLPLAFGMKTDLEAFPTELLREILTYSTIIFMNETEEQDIVGLLKLDQITDLFDMGNVEILIVTHGKKGSIFWEKTEQGLISDKVGIVQAKRVLDTAGSGDSYISGFVYGYLNGFSTKESCLLGSAMASFIIEEMGCTTNAPSLENLMKRFKESLND